MWLVTTISYSTAYSKLLIEMSNIKHTLFNILCHNSNVSIWSLEAVTKPFSSLFRVPIQPFTFCTSLSLMHQSYLEVCTSSPRVHKLLECRNIFLNSVCLTDHTTVHYIL